ncbi:MAG: hypothetical protein JWO63_2125 [Frankiales bacterium]|nr:hypothetical protein [Frankiales bacterium]
MSDKTVIVTGASRGIGKQIAIELGRRGYNVVVAARTVTAHHRLAGSIGETVEAITAAGGQALAVQTDVRSVDSVADLVRAAVEAFGGVDVLVNNAADTSGGTPGLTELKLEDWLAQLDTNLHGPLRLMQAVVPEMRKRGGGTIINLTSGAGDLVDTTGDAGADGGSELAVLGGERLAYAASKAALNRLGNALSAELAADGIALVSVDPGFTRTELVELMGDKGIVDAELAVPMSTPMRAVVQLITTDEGMRLRGQIVRASEYVEALGVS